VRWAARLPVLGAAVPPSRTRALQALRRTIAVAGG
jgi:hypothetical protein